MNKSLGYFLGKQIAESTDTNENKSVNENVDQLPAEKRAFFEKIADYLDRFGVFEKYGYSHTASVIFDVVNDIKDKSELSTNNVSVYADTVRDRLEFGYRREGVNEGKSRNTLPPEEVYYYLRTIHSAHIKEIVRFFEITHNVDQRVLKGILNKLEREGKVVHMKTNAGDRYKAVDFNESVNYEVTARDLDELDDLQYNMFHRIRDRLIAKGYDEKKVDYNVYDFVIDRIHAGEMDSIGSSDISAFANSVEYSLKNESVNQSNEEDMKKLEYFLGKEVNESIESSESGKVVMTIDGTIVKFGYIGNGEVYLQVGNEKVIIGRKEVEEIKKNVFSAS